MVREGLTVADQDEKADDASGSNAYYSKSDGPHYFVTV